MTTVGHALLGASIGLTVLPRMPWLPLQLADDSINVRVMHERTLKLWNNSIRMLRMGQETCATQHNAGRHRRGALD